MIEIRNALFILLIGFSSELLAIPGTDISILRLINQSANEPLKAEFVKTAVKRKGYDNQPYFFDDQTLLFTRELKSQTDIFRLGLVDNQIQAITNTLVSEYSPTPIPKNLEGDFSVIVASEGIQHLWIYKNGKAIERINGDIEPVGYHAWLSESDIAMFRLAEPHELVMFNIENEQSGVVAKNIGRTLISPSTNKLFFIQNNDDSSDIVEYNHKSGKKLVFATLDKEQLDFTWHSKVGLVAAKGNDIYYYADSQWKKIEVDLPENIRNISRLAISPSGEWLAFVHGDI